MIAIIQWVLYTILLLTTGALSSINGAGLAWFAVAGILTPGLFMAFFYIGVQRIGAARAATIKSAAPVYAVICATIFLGERPSILQFFGIACSNHGRVDDCVPERKRNAAGGEAGGHRPGLR